MPVARLRSASIADGRHRVLATVALSASVSLGLAACGGGGGLSATNRVQTAAVCVQAAADLPKALSVGAKLGSRTISPAAAKQQLQPVQAKIETLAKANASLPIGPKLQSLAAAVTAIEQLSAPQPDYTTLATTLRSNATGVVDACAAVLK